MAGGHEDGLALVEDVLHAVHGDAPLAVHTQHQRVAAGLVGADLLSLVEGEQRNADGIVLRQRLADHLTGLVGHLLLHGQNGGNVVILHHGRKLLP
mgnify:CR=1 FL=1